MNLFPRAQDQEPGGSPAAQPKTTVPSDTTSPIDISEASAEDLGSAVDERGLPRSIAGEIPAKAGGAGANPAGTTGRPPGPPPPPAPSSSRGRKARGETGGPIVVAGGAAPKDRAHVLDRLRRGDSLRGASLRGVDLSEAKLDGADLSRADLDGADLRGAKLENAVFKGASLRAARLDGADLRGAILEGADLSGAGLSAAILIEANLTAARLENADFSGAAMAGANMTGAQLSGAKLTGANLKESRLLRAHLRGADLSSSKALGADFTDVDARGAVLSECDLTGAILDEARLVGASATHARLGGVSMRHADLRRSDLSRADLSHADLRRADLSFATVSGACFSGAKIDGMIPIGGETTAVRAAWLDTSPAGDGSTRVEGAAAVPRIFGERRDADRPKRRYFGAGDVVRDAAFTFGDEARVEIDSRLEGCTIELGSGAELVIGRAGGLIDCQITGGARVVVHGVVYEGKAPAVQGTQTILVGPTGAVKATIEQAAGGTRFGFERGCRLRVALSKRSGEPDELERDKTHPGTAALAFASASDTAATVLGHTGRLRGDLASEGPMLVRASVEGGLQAPRIELSETASVKGTLTATELRSRGAISGEVIADAVELSGLVADGSVVRAKTLFVPWQEPNFPAPRFGQVTLEVGAEPTPDPLPDESAPVEAAGASEDDEVTDAESDRPQPKSDA